MQAAQIAHEFAQHDPAPRFREMMAEDTPHILQLCGRFFLESEFSGFSTFDPDSLMRLLERIPDNPKLDCFVFEDKGVPQGFLIYQTDTTYTVEPLALMFLFYVAPEYRKSPVGRSLLTIAETHAKARGCVAFYGGAMAGIPGVTRTLKNLYTKAGYEELYWGRKLLQGDDE